MSHSLGTDDCFVYAELIPKHFQVQILSRFQILLNLETPQNHQFTKIENLKFR